MGLKENVEALKQELSTEEQFLESVIKAEGFFKKYKKLLLALTVVMVVGIIAYLTIDYIKNRDLQMANQALVTLQDKPDDKSVLETLKGKNPALHALFVFSQAVKSNDPQKIAAIEKELDDPILKDLAQYQTLSLLEDEKGFTEYEQKQDALLKEVALLDDAFILFQSGNSKAAKERLGQIAVTSPLYGIVQNFMHYQK